MQRIIHYFPTLSSTQVHQLEMMKPLYDDWNAKINVISRKDMDSFYERHVLHSVAIARVCSFAPGAEVVDIGTGGGFPAIPLAILFPEVHFTAVDSIAKKIKVVTEVTQALQLPNLTPLCTRAESLRQQSFDYVVSRAVTEMKTFAQWAMPLLREGKKGTLDNGILYLKGGDLKAELKEAKKPYRLFSIKDHFEEAFFEEKYVVHMPL